MDKKCPYCEADNNDFMPLNQTVEYSGIEISLNRQGMLRVRFYNDVGHIWFSEDIINIVHCPMCGKEFGGT